MTIEFILNIPFLPYQDIVNINFKILLMNELNNLFIKSELNFFSNRDGYFLTGNILEYEKVIEIKGPKIDHESSNNFRQKYKNIYEKNNYSYAVENLKDLKTRIIEALKKTINNNNWSNKSYFNNEFISTKPISGIGIKLEREVIYAYGKINLKNIDIKKIIEYINKSIEKYALEYKVFYNNDLINRIGASCLNINEHILEIEEKYYVLPEKLVSLYLENNHDGILLVKNEKYYCLYFCEIEKINKKKIENSISCKLFDALYLYNLDINKPIEYYLQLNENKFINNLNILEINKKIFKIALEIGKKNSINNENLKKLILYNNMDICSETVSEFPKLIGIVGSKICNNPYLTDFYKDKLTLEAKILFLSEKILNFQLYENNLPTGSRDPFGMKKQIKEFTNILIESKITFDLDLLKGSKEFVLGRINKQLEEINENLKYLNFSIFEKINNLDAFIDFNVLKRIENLFKKKDLKNEYVFNEKELGTMEINLLKIEYTKEYFENLNNYLNNNIIVSDENKIYILQTIVKKFNIS